MLALRQKPTPSQETPNSQQKNSEQPAKKTVNSQRTTSQQPPNSRQTASVGQQFSSQQQEESRLTCEGNKNTVI